jgi:hypothetical protein
MSAGELEFNWMLCATHYIADGMALHTIANDFFTLLGSDHDESQLRAIIHSEFNSNQPETGFQLPLELESRLPETRPKSFFEAIATVDHLLNQRKQIVCQPLLCGWVSFLGLIRILSGWPRLSPTLWETSPHNRAYSLF